MTLKIENVDKIVMRPNGEQRVYFSGYVTPETMHDVDAQKYPAFTYEVLGQQFIALIYEALNHKEQIKSEVSIDG